MERNEIASLCFLHSIPGIGNKTLWRIKQQVGSFAACLAGDGGQWERCSLSTAVCSALVEARQQDHPLSAYERLSSQGIRMCAVDDQEYPEMLRAIYDPPYILYYRGDIGVLQKFCLAVVGSRIATTYGRIQAGRLARELAAEGMVVVSGMARGIDTEAHRGALEAGGKTAAVLGSGIDVIYPRENKKLYDQIVEAGVVLSEFSPGTRPEPGNFPARNRTISGLSHGVLVVEAKQRSGALITTDFALEQGRDVFAIPGPVNSQNSFGTNHLIKQGACLVTSIEDILHEYGWGDSVRTSPGGQGEVGSRQRDAEEAAVLDAIAHEAVHFDAILEQTNLGPGRLSMVLLRLELEGTVRAMPGNYYGQG